MILSILTWVATATVPVSSPDERWRGHAFAQATRFALGDHTTWLRAGVAQRLTLSRDTALELETAWERDYGADRARVELRFDAFF